MSRLTYLSRGDGDYVLFPVDAAPRIALKGFINKGTNAFVAREWIMNYVGDTLAENAVAHGMLEPATVDVINVSEEDLHNPIDHDSLDDHHVAMTFIDQQTGERRLTTIAELKVAFHTMCSPIPVADFTPRAN